MPDDRLFHPALGHSEKVNKLTALERDVWMFFKLAADDFGVMRFSATPMQDAARWLERVPARRLLRALQIVCEVGLIQRIEHQGQPYVFDPVWQTWQKITHPRQTKQPRPTDSVIDLNTQWLFSHHPKGGKLTAWQHPDLRQTKPGRLPGKEPEATGSLPGADRKLTGRPPERLPSCVGVSGSGGVGVGVGGGSPAAADPTNARSRRPVYTSDRFAVFEWQLDELSKTLGAHYETFDLHAFFDGLSQQSRSSGLVIPKADAWLWLQAQVLAEAKRRGLPMASVVPVRDKAAEEAAQNARILALIQEDPRHARR